MLGSRQEEQVLQLIESRVRPLEEKVEHLENELNHLKVCLETERQSSFFKQDLLHRLIDDNTQYSKKTNLIVDGLNIKDGANDNQIRRLVVNEIKHLKLDIFDFEVDRAHRIGKAYRDKRGKMHIPVVVRFTSWYARNVMYNARKKSNFFWKADVTARRQKILDEATSRVGTPGSLAESLVSTVLVDRNCHLTLITKDSQFFKFNSIVEFDSLKCFQILGPRRP